MKVAPLMEEVMDLRRKIHIINAETFLKTRNDHFTLVSQADALMNNSLHREMKEKVESIRRKGAYYSVRGENNFVRYTKNLAELNNSLRRIVSTLQSAN